MTYYADLDHDTMVIQGDHVRAIGWLSGHHAYPTGEVPSDFAAKLKSFCSHWSQSAHALGFGIFMGTHTCELCSAYMADGNIGVPAGDLLYVAPEMVHHYVQEHQYRPPDEFLEAVMDCPLPSTAKYKELAKPFHDLQDAYHDQRWDRMVVRAAEWARANGGPSVVKDAASRILGNSCEEYAQQVRKALRSLDENES